MAVFGFIKSKKDQQEKEFYEIIRTFREKFPAVQGWSINVYQKDNLVTCKIQRNKNIMAQATVERDFYCSLVEAERACIFEALIRFGFVPVEVQK